MLTVNNHEKSSWYDVRVNMIFGFWYLFSNYNLK